ncbi:hypothetical protein N0824_03266 [Microcystis sp. 0824]|nr:hypothetical protein N0824_03266 [Microcystis sp. 0824]
MSFCLEPTAFKTISGNSTSMGIKLTAPLPLQTAWQRRS